MKAETKPQTTVPSNADAKQVPRPSLMTRNERSMIKKVPTVLIFGISSFIGSNLAELLRREFHVIGTYHEHPVHIPGVLTFSCDVLKKNAVQSVIFHFRPDITIYAVGLSSVQDCRRHPQLAETLNTGGVYNVSEFCDRYKSMLVYLSSAFVFQGDDCTYLESDNPNSNTVFGHSKSSIEFYIQRTSINYLILRCCNIYGRSHHPCQLTKFEELQNSCISGQEFVVDRHVIIGHLDVVYLAMIIKLCWENKISNRLFHVSSSDQMSYFDFAQLYAKVFAQSAVHIRPGIWPLNSSNDNEDLFFRLDTANLAGQINVALPTIEESLRLTKQRWNINAPLHYWEEQLKKVKTASPAADTTTDSAS
ncbi:MAG: sugar nucleotide-binding protein [Bacteriovoracaceae bacterium]|nr:sugar nucleotide-binding protein [Bacteriovoracaceae bacterium]